MSAKIYMRERPARMVLDYKSAIVRIFRHSRASGNPGGLQKNPLDSRLRGNDGMLSFYGKLFGKALPTS